MASVFDIKTLNQLHCTAFRRQYPTMGSPSHQSELEQVVSFQRLSLQLVCAACNRDTRSLQEALLLQIANEKFKSTVGSPYTTGNSSDMPGEFAVPAAKPTNGTLASLNTSPATDLQANGTSCCYGESTLSSPPISECSTCARVLGHGPFSLFREIDELFGPSACDAQRPISNSTETQLEVDNLRDWEIVGGASLGEIAVMIDERISPMQLFLDPHTEDPWVLSYRSGTQAPNTYPVEDDEAWIDEEPSEYTSTSLGS